MSWVSICSTEDIAPSTGVRALYHSKQVAIFNINSDFYAIDAVDPFTQAAVLSRGIVGDVNGRLVVASPIYKQHFCLKTGACLEDESVSVTAYHVRNNNGKIEVSAQ